MLFLGHIAASLLIADATKSDRNAAIIGNLTPDVIDKTGGWLLKLAPSRWVAHGLPFFGLMSLAAGLVLNRRSWRGYVLGYAGHLICDLWAGGRVPWFAPFEAQKNRRNKRRSARRWAIYLIPEVVGAGLIAWLANREAKS